MNNITLIQAAFGFMGFDVVTGVISAFKHHELNSRKAREGMYNKVGWSLLILFSVYLSYITPVATMGQLYIPGVEAVCGIIFFIEFQSIIENICRMLPDDVALKVRDLFRLNNSEKFGYLATEPDDSEFIYDNTEELYQ